MSPTPPTPPFPPATRPANGRWRYIVTSSLIGWVHTQNEPWSIDFFMWDIFSCGQAALWMVQSVCLSVRHTFLTMFPSSYYHEIFKSYYQWQKWCPCKKSRSEVKGQGHRGKKLIEFDPIWAFPDCNSSLCSPMATKWWTKLEVA